MVQKLFARQTCVNVSRNARFRRRLPSLPSQHQQHTSRRSQTTFEVNTRQIDTSFQTNRSVWITHATPAWCVHVHMVSAGCHAFYQTVVILGVCKRYVWHRMFVWWNSLSDGQCIVLSANWLDMGAFHATITDILARDGHKHTQSVLRLMVDKG